MTGSPPPTAVVSTTLLVEGAVPPATSIPGTVPTPQKESRTMTATDIALPAPHVVLPRADAVPGAAPGTADRAVAPADPAARVLVAAAAAYGWPAAVALVFLYESTGPVPRVWRLWRVLGPGDDVLREWEGDPRCRTDESEREIVALDLLLDSPATRHHTDFAAPCASTVLMVHRLAL